jgi:hypothetical protein
MAGGIADHTLHVAAHLFRCDRAGNGKAQKIRGDNRHKLYRKQIHEFQAGIALVNVVKDQVRLVLEQAFPWSRDGFEMKV